MRLKHVCRDSRFSRSGKILIMCALLLTVLLGWLGVVIDTGRLYAAHRNIQNAADAAALDAAWRLQKGDSQSTALAAAKTFIQTNYGLPSSAINIQFSPTQGAFKGNANFVQATVTYSVGTTLTQLVGGSKTETIQAVAVAGPDAAAAHGTVYTLDPSAAPGVTISKNSSLSVNGIVFDNSEASPAASISSSATFKAALFDVAGSSVSGKVQPYASGGANPQNTGSLHQPDPFTNVGTPNSSQYSTLTTNNGTVTTKGSTTTYNPGVYSSISINPSSGQTVVFNPGVYIIQGGGISITGNGTVTATGVMFYNTGDDFSPSKGTPDNTDGETVPPAGSGCGSSGIGGWGGCCSGCGLGNCGGSGCNASGVTINPGSSMTLNLTGLNLPSSNPLSAFNGFLIYQRRFDTQQIDIEGNLTNSGPSQTIQGTVYGKWSPITFASNGSKSSTFGIQAVGGSVMDVDGTTTLDTTGATLPKVTQVYLVE